MAEATTLGTWLRRERERRGVSLTSIADQTKLSIPLLQGLEADDLSRWPGGIFRRAFARSYATAIGVDPDLVVRRLEEEHPSQDGSARSPIPCRPLLERPVPRLARLKSLSQLPPTSSRVLGVAAVLDLLVAGAIGMGFAAGGSRLLWPVLAIALYHAPVLIFTGRSPMLALLLDQGRADVRSSEHGRGSCRKPRLPCRPRSRRHDRGRHRSTPPARPSLAWIARAAPLLKRLRDHRRPASRAGIGERLAAQSPVKEARMGILAWIVFGLVVGIIAKLLMPGRDPGGFIVTILLGIAGALLGGFIGRAMGFYGPSQQAGWLISILGAVILLVIYRVVANAAKRLTHAGARGVAIARAPLVPLRSTLRFYSDHHALHLYAVCCSCVTSLSTCRSGRLRAERGRDRREEPRRERRRRKAEGRSDDETHGHHFGGRHERAVHDLVEAAEFRATGDRDAGHGDGPRVRRHDAVDDDGSGRSARSRGPEAQATREQADFDSPLVDYRAKGNTVELVGPRRLTASRSITSR